MPMQEPHGELDGIYDLNEIKEWYDGRHRAVEIEKRRAEARQYREENVATQERKGRLFARAKGISLLLAISLTVSSMTSLILAIFFAARPNFQPGPPPEDGLTPEERSVLVEAVERWRNLDNEAVWQAIATFTDSWDPSWQAQILMMDTIKKLSQPLSQPWTWRGDDAVSYVLALVEAYDSFSAPPAFQKRARALYVAVGPMKYDVMNDGKPIPLPRQVAADLVELAITGIILRSNPLAAKEERSGMSDPIDRQDATAAGPNDVPKVGAAVGAGSLSVLTSAISVGQMVLFAFGPEGVIAAAGLQVLELCFGSDQNKPVNLPKVINDLVVQDFANDHVKTDLATIVGYASWLSEQNDQAISGRMPDKQQNIYADTLAQLKQYVVNACDPGSQLRTAISNLQNGDYTSDPPFCVLGLPAFLLGAFLHLAFERARLLLSNDATTFRSPLASNIARYASNYLDYLKNTLEIIDNDYGHRLNGVSRLLKVTLANG
jgi:hypothetical protein